MTSRQIVFLVFLLMNIPVILFIGRNMYGRKESFIDSLKWALIPDLWSLFRGQWMRDQRGSFRLWKFVMITILVLLIEWAIRSGIYEAIFE